MIGYHANDRKRCTKFINDSKYLIIDENDTDFLGRGMYFWEHESRAKWWLDEKKKEVIVKANLSLKNILDLTDDEKLGYIERVADKFDSAMRRKGIKQKNVGLKLNYIFETLKNISDMYDSVKGYIYYKRKEESSFLFNTKLTGKCVAIYCIRKNPDLVTERRWVRK